MKKIYLAHIYHKRFLPSVNEFLYKGLYVKFDIEKINTLKSWYFGVNSFAPFSFYSIDHGFRNTKSGSLKYWALDLLKKSGIRDFKGKIYLQTFPRVLGYVFNPVSFWYCYEKEELVAVICEVNNTFGESHNYVLKNRPDKEVLKLQKEFHVSPFYQVEGEYSFDFRKENRVKIDYHLSNELQLKTSIEGKEIPWCFKSFLVLFFKFPLYTLSVVFLIHYQALKLYFKKNKFYHKPDRKTGEELTYEYSNK